jgi:hypothetical protein
MIYVYDCPDCGAEIERECRVANMHKQQCRCGAHLKKRYLSEGIKIMVPLRWQTNQEDMRQFVDPDPPGD